VSDYFPVTGDEPGVFTLTAGGTITGGQIVELNANDQVIASAGAGARAIGVAAHDAVSGGRLAIYPLSDIIHETPITGVVVIAAGAPVKSAAAGAVDTGTLGALAAAGTLLGICVRGATGPAKCRWIGL